jgi:hypothetical protein
MNHHQKINSNGFFTYVVNIMKCSNTTSFLCSITKHALSPSYWNCLLLLYYLKFKIEIRYNNCFRLPPEFLDSIRGLRGLHHSCVILLGKSRSSSDPLRFLNNYFNPFGIVNSSTRKNLVFGKNTIKSATVTI